MASRPSSANSNFPKVKDFVLTEKLGSGSYATVYKAYRKTGRREVVAIKCVLKSTLNKSSTENLLTEIELLKKLKHDHIVGLKDFQWDDSHIYLIMEYCSGGDLSRFIQSKRRLPGHIVKRFLQQMAMAIKYLNENNVAHMDLKPQNVLLTSSSHPILKIGDFGFAKHLYQGDELNKMRGSPLYMAPEIICKGAYDARVDLWSIGVILYECLFGKAPFASKTFKELGAKIWDSKPVELPYGVEVCDDCRDLVLRLLKRDPDERIQFAEFFSHPFVDIVHAPSSKCLSQAITIVNDAVIKDKAGDYESAVKLYCRALEYFVPAMHYEESERRKDVLRQKVKEYMDRAEELKQQMKPQMKPQDTKLNRSNSNPDPSDTFQELCDLCNDNDEFTAALRLIKAAQSEVSRENFKQALRHYEVSLEALLKLLPAEPKGKRKDLLRQELDKWFSAAENIKSYLSVETLNTSDLEDTQDDTSASAMSNCLIQ